MSGTGRAARTLVERTHSAGLYAGRTGVRALSLRSNVFWTLASNIVYAGCQWGMLVILARLGSPETVGQFALGLAVTAPAFMFANLQLRAVQATDARRAYRFADYFGLRCITTTAALAAIAIVAVGAGYRSETAPVIFAVGTAKAVESFSDVFYGRLQQHERLDRVAISTMLKGPTSLAALGLGVYLGGGGVVWGAVGMAAASAIVLLFYDVRGGAVVPGERSGFELRTIGRLAWTSLPLGIVMLLISLNTNIPRYFVEAHGGEHELGLFGAMAYPAVAGTTMVAALGQSASPRLARYHADGDIAAFRALLLRLAGGAALIGAAGLAVALAAGRDVLRALYGPEYAPHADVLAWLMASAAVGYVASILGYAMTGARRFLVQPVLWAACSAFVAAGCWLWLPRYGLVGAAWALGVSSLIQLAGALLCLVQAMKRRLPS